MNICSKSHNFVSGKLISGTDPGVVFGGGEAIKADDVWATTGPWVSRGRAPVGVTHERS